MDEPPETDREPTRIDSLRSVFGIALVLGAIALLIAWRHRLPVPNVALGPTTNFSEGRARATAAYLTEHIGLRFAGTEGARASVPYLRDQLATIPRLEVQTQDATGAATQAAFSDHVTLYTVHNVLARLPGRSRDAILLSAHYDSPIESVGAADDAAMVGVLIDMLRVLAAEPQLALSVIVNLNDGEESGILGSSAFSAHPWHDDVRGFVNLEAGGTSGRAVVFQADAGARWMLDAYARAAPHPHMSSLAQDVFSTGRIPANTDWQVYRASGLHGLDIVLLDDAYAYHTFLDRMPRIAPGTLQFVGDDVVALVRALASNPVPVVSDRARPAFFDVLGALPIVLGGGALRIFVYGAAIVALVAAVAAIRRRRIVDVAFAGARWIGRWLAALALTCAFAFAASAVFDHPHGWLRSPWLPIASYAAIAVASYALLHLKGRTDRVAEMAIMAAVVSPIAAYMALRGIGSSYLLAIELLCTSAVLGAGVLFSPVVARRVLWSAFAIAATVGLEVTAMSATAAVPIFTRLPTPFAADVIVAMMFTLLLMPTATRAVRLLRGRFAAALFGGVLLLVGVVTWAQTLRLPVYDHDHPRRMMVEHEEAFGQSRIVMRLLDYPAPGGAFGTNLPLPRYIGRTGSRAYRFPFRSWSMPAFPSPHRAIEVRIDLLSRSGTRRRMRATYVPRGEARAELAIPTASLRAWSLPMAIPNSAAGQAYVVFVGAPPAGASVDLEFDGNDEVSCEATGFWIERSWALNRAMQALPDWVAAFGFVSRTDRLPM